MWSPAQLQTPSRVASSVRRTKPSDKRRPTGAEMTVFEQLSVQEGNLLFVVRNPFPGGRFFPFGIGQLNFLGGEIVDFVGAFGPENLCDNLV